MVRKRILPGMSTMESIEVITDNNLKVYMLIVDIIFHLNENGMGSSGSYVDVLGCFDNAGMYGDDIYTFYSKVCKNNLQLFIALMQSCQHSDSNQVDCKVLEKYLKSRGIESVDLDSIQKDVKKYLPDFDFFLINSD